VVREEKVGSPVGDLEYGAESAASEEEVPDGDVASADVSSVDVSVPDVLDEVPDKDFVLDDVGEIDLSNKVKAEIQAEAEAWVGCEWPEANPAEVKEAAAEVASVRLRAFETGVLNYREAQQVGKRLVERFG
jgi:hypothetical protein